MKKTLLLLALAAISLAVAFRYSRSDFSWVADADDTNGAIADIDQPLPHAVLPSIENDWVDLSSYKGQVVFITFWTTWCSGCTDEVPSLIRLQQRFGAQGFTVLGVAVDDEGEESVESFARKRSFPVDGKSVRINYPVLMGSEESARKLGFEGGLPAGVLVNRDGKEVKIVRGIISEEALTRAVQKLVKK